MLAICSAHFWCGWVSSLYGCFKFTCTDKDHAQNVFHAWYVFQWDNRLLSIVLTATYIMKRNFSCSLRLKLILGEILIKTNPRIDLWTMNCNHWALCFASGLMTMTYFYGHIESWIFLVYNPGRLELQMYSWYHELAQYDFISRCMWGKEIVF